MTETEILRWGHVLHFDGKDFFGDEWQCVERPRLQRREEYPRSHRSKHPRRTIWRVDGHDVADYAVAVAALARPVALTTEEIAALELLTDEWQPLREMEARVGAGDHVEGYRHLHALAMKGLAVYERILCDTRSDGQPWDDFVPAHQRGVPHVRKVQHGVQAD